MSLNNVPAGQYVARPTGGAWSKVGEKETPCVMVDFEFNHEGANHRITKTFYLTDKMLESGDTVALRTIKTFVDTLGYDEAKPLVNNRITKEHFSVSEVSITLEKRLSEKGTTYTEVSWVNPIGGGNYKAMAPEEVMGGVNYRALFANARGGKPKASTPSAHSHQEEAPF